MMEVIVYDERSKVGIIYRINAHNGRIEQKPIPLKSNFETIQCCTYINFTVVVHMMTDLQPIYVCIHIELVHTPSER
jgi:hypothetical protein